ncbi:hypothetical protein JCGZ_06520 [Jatropha curcas]|uniref:Uncharacterized protein n=1 Tax=Jatropha curcas TaxID=180498 RepID=A0A067LEE3_JATCU|nr:hypothetical protein JCGZ_06520 [Jatropha curcas]
MARGRTVDLDASGSATFFFNASGASSSTQPPVPPSLSSVPSSFTSIPRPVESSPASQSPTVPGETACRVRAHAMWMSGQHGAGTSSSDPPPATDRDVSIALHQPLPSPLDPDTTNDTLVTPADTTTHPADTPPGATTLDCADDQPCRSDFGPF